MRIPRRVLARWPMISKSRDAPSRTVRRLFLYLFFLGLTPSRLARSWSYDNVKTYDIMQVPQKKVKKMEKQIQLIDGEKVEVEVEVEVIEPLKRLFNFAPSMSRMSPP